jgi:multiple sugar transport system substrate-binding protein/sn-glycerol 3-phosphate transport system substrate-binding protein
MYKQRIYRVLAVIMVLAMILSACKTTQKAEPTATTAPQPTAKVEPTEAPKATEPAKPTEAPEPTKPPAVAAPTATEVPAVEDAWADVDPSGQTIAFWHNHTGDRETGLNELIQEFNDTNEWGITIQGEYQGSYNDIFNKMLTFINTPDVPGVVVAYQNQAATYQVANGVVDMNPLVNSPKWGLTEAEQADFFPGFWEQDVFPMFNGARLGIPPNRSMEVVFYNTEWLAELKAAGKIDFDGAPQTPEQFKAAACAATDNPFSKAVAEGSVGYELSIDTSRFASWTFAFGGDIFDYQNSQFTLDSDAAKAAWEYLQGLFKDGCAALPTEAFGDQTDFGAGKLLFSIGSTSGLPFYQTAVDAGAAFEWSVAALPHTTAEPVMNIYGASVSIPNNTPEKELAAWLFIKWYTSPEIQAKWAIISNYFPVRASVAEGLADYFTENPTYKTGFDMLQYGHFEPPVPGYDFVRQKVNEAIAAIIADPFPSVADTLTGLNSTGNTLLAEQMAMVPEPADEWFKVDPNGQKVVFWHQHTKAREESLLQIVDEFNQTNEWGITVEAIYQGGYTDIFNKMLTVLNTQDVPDLVVAYQNQAATYQVAEALVDMNSLVKSYKWGLSQLEQRDFFKGFFSQDVFPNFKNARLGFPPNRSEEVMYYNVDWLKELGYDAPPTTPDQFKEMACKAAEQKFSKGSGDTSTGYTLSFGNDIASNIPSWTFAFGGDIFDYKKGQFTYNSDAAIAAVTFLQDLFKSGCASQATVAFEEQTYFAAGQSLFTVGSTSGFGNYKSAVEAGSVFNWSIAPLPYTGKNPAMNVYGASVSMPKTTPERELATWLFLKYYTSPEVQAKWAQASGYFPVRASVAEGLADYFTANPLYKQAFDLLQYAKYEPPVPGYDFVRSKLVEVINALIADPYPDVTAALDVLNQVANDLLAEQLTIIPTPAPTTAP